MAEEKFIEIKGAREHNLKNVDINIPKDKLTVITGLSGSGKSMPRGNADMWKVCLLMRANFWS